MHHISQKCTVSFSHTIYSNTSLNIFENFIEISSFSTSAKISLNSLPFERITDSIYSLRPHSQIQIISVFYWYFIFASSSFLYVFLYSRLRRNDHLLYNFLLFNLFHTFWEYLLGQNWRVFSFVHIPPYPNSDLLWESSSCRWFDFIKEVLILFYFFNHLL